MDPKELRTWILQCVGAALFAALFYALMVVTQ